MAVPNYNPRKINRRVANMRYAADVDADGSYTADLGTPVVANPTAILNAQSIATAGSVQSGSLLTDTVDARYGRNATVVASGAATSAVDLYGRDYLGQPMRETFTLNGATPVAGKKAFKWFDQIVFAATAGTTINVGFGDVLGLPYRTLAIRDEFADKVRDGTGFTFVAPLAETTTATATTADPRGTVDPNTTLNGVKRITGTFLADKSNLHGNAHFYG